MKWSGPLYNSAIPLRSHKKYTNDLNNQIKNNNFKLLACLRVQVNVAVLLGAPRERAQAELKAGKLTMRVHRFFLLCPFKLFSELKETAYVSLLKIAIQNRMILVC